MILGQNYSRGMRIVGKPGDVTPFAVFIYDAKTGEKIDNVFRMEVILDVRQLNSVRLHYKDADQEEKTVTVPVHSVVDVTAIERK